MVQSSKEFTTLTDLNPVLSEIFYQRYAQFAPILRPMAYGIRGSNKSAEHVQQVGSFADPQEFDGQVEYDTADEGYLVTFTHAHLTLGFKVTQTMIEDQQYDGIFTRADNLAQSFGRKRLKDEASPFENAFNTGADFLGYDGKPLCSTTHPRSKTDTTNVSNSLGTKALTSTNLEEAITTLMGIKDDKGNEINALPNVLLVGRNQKKKALELTGSELSPEDANNAINVHGDMMTVVHPYITGNKWFVLDSMMAQTSLLWYNRFSEALFYQDVDQSNTLMHSFVGRDRYSFGWTDFRFVVGSNAS